MTIFTRDNNDIAEDEDVFLTKNVLNHNFREDEIYKKLMLVTPKEITNEEYFEKSVSENEKIITTNSNSSNNSSSNYDSKYNIKKLKKLRKRGEFLEEEAEDNFVYSKHFENKNNVFEDSEDLEGFIFLFLFLFLKLFFYSFLALFIIIYFLFLYFSSDIYLKKYIYRRRKK
jgi:hypothetical protein